MEPPAEPTARLIVAMIEYPNGMASWCWEAALALQAQGRRVVLVVSPDTKLPDEPPVEIVRFQAASKYERVPGLRGRLRHVLSGTLAGPFDELLPALHRLLLARQITPTGYFLNNSQWQHPAVDVPQYVVAWAYPCHLPGYLSKVGTLSGWRSAKAVVSMVLQAVGCWRKDWRAYRHAAGVMAVTDRLAGQLTARRVRNVQVVHPGTALPSAETVPPAPSAAHISLLIAALDLEEPRKRVEWMVRALAGLPPERFHLTLAGGASDAFQTRARKALPGVTFTGVLPREETLAVMRRHDVFLMGSCLDDWGYVLIEAMANGLVPVAADQTPFDEIVGDTGVLYRTHSPGDFARRVRSLEPTRIPSMKQANAARAAALFSRQRFGATLLRVMPGERQGTF